jgi:beta-galactosidase
VLTPRVPHVLYGGDYTPEQWSPDVWLEDAQLMQEAGINLVTVGVFSWARLEPIPGTYDFDWMDRVLGLLHEHGVFVDLATATASPPPWLARRYPETLPVTKDGVVLWPGARQHYCPSSPIYRGVAAELVERLAERYSAHPALAMWHVNNEYGCHVPACYCDRSACAFREWLKARYGTLEGLNEAWGTTFWSQIYSDWDEINPPRRAPYLVNPCQELDFRRFSSDALLECFEAEQAILKRHTPDVPVTTNFMGFFKPCDYWKWASREDVVSHDSYPDPSDPEAPVEAAISFDLMRSLGQGRSWLLMEQASSYVNWRARNVPKRPGQMRLWSYQAVARGADGVMFFQWRASRAGAEKFHSALVPHGPPQDSRVWVEARDLGRELKKLDAVLETRVQASVGVVFDWANWWALELPSKPSADLRMMEQLRAYYRPLFQANVPVDFVRPQDDLSGYRLVIIPNLYLVASHVPESFERFVSSGGTLVMGFFTGIADERDHVWLGGYPAPFRRLLGVRIGEFGALADRQELEVEFAGGERGRSDLWADPIELEGAEAIATYAAGPLSGRPALTRNRLGKGTAYYVGTRLGSEAMNTFLAGILDEQALRPSLNAPAGVEVVRRSADARSYVFILNHSEDPVEVKLDRPLEDLLTQKRIPKILSLEPYGLAILHEGGAGLRT